MKDEFEATFTVEVATREVWETLAGRIVGSEGANAPEVHVVLPGFPSLEPLDIPGARCTLVEARDHELLRVRKDHHPCQGSEIAIRLEDQGTRTRITVVQSGFGAFLDFAGRDTVFAHGGQIVRDLQLFIERGLTVPGTTWGPDLGASLEQTPTGLALLTVSEGGFAEQAGLRAQDLLLTVRGIRIHDLQQLWTLLALSQPGESADVTWARGREPMSGKATL